MKKKRKANPSIASIASQGPFDGDKTSMIVLRIMTKQSPALIPPAEPPKNLSAIKPEGKAIAIRPPEVERMPKTEMAKIGRVCSSSR